MEPLKTTIDSRQAAGVQAIGSLVNYWLVRGNLSHDQLVSVLNWSIGESCRMQGGVLSRIRNANQKRGASLQHLDAMAEGNRLIWLWQQQGQQQAIRRFGPFSGWGIQPGWLDHAIWLPSVADGQQPLNLGELAQVLAGRLELPYLSGDLLNPVDARRLNQQLSPLLDQIAAERGWGPRQAIEEFQAAYPSTDRGRVQRLKGLVVGDETLNPTELENEMPALAEMIRQVRGLKLDEYGPGELRSELLSARRQLF